MGEERHFETGGGDYAAHRPTYPPALAQALAARCARTTHALDVGCGTGQLSVLLAGAFERVTATDPSAAQIANATAHERIVYRVEPAETIGLPDASVDLVVAAQAAHWFDLDRFYAEVRRVARPGAVLALVSYGVPAIDAGIGPLAERFERFYWHEIHRHWPPGRAHVEQGYRALAFPFDEKPFAPLAITRDWDFSALEGYIRTWSAAKRAAQAGDHAALEDGLADLATLWGGADTRHRVAWPLVARLAVIS